MVLGDTVIGADHARMVRAQGETFNDLTRTDIAYVADVINHRYRNLLAYDSAAERFADERAAQLE